MRAFIAVGFLVVSLACFDAAAEHRVITVEDAVARALDENPRMVAARARARAAQDRALSEGARMLPSVHLSDEWQYWNSAYAPPITTPLGNLAFKVRDQSVNTFSAAGAQPLVGLFHIAEDYWAAKKGGEAGAVRVKAAEQALKEGLRNHFIEYFEAKAEGEIAAASEAQLAEQVNVASAKVHAGVLTNADFLRVKVAAANARQQAIVAQSNADVARTQILVAIGMSPDDGEIDLGEPSALLASADAAIPSFDDASRTADTRRPELAAARLDADSARHTKRARLASLLPDVDLEAAYLRVDGQIFQPPNSEFVGIKASWAIWEWGASFFAYRAAAEQALAFAADADNERRVITTEVGNVLSQMTASRSAVTLAQETISSAEEAYRVTNAQVQAGSATTTDLLDSQAALTQARLNLTRARYQLAATRVRLDRATGS